MDTAPSQPVLPRRNSPRFTRKDAAQIPFTFTENLHRPILEALHTYRFLTGDLTALAIGKPRSTTRKALQRLWKHRYLNRVKYERQIVHSLPDIKLPTNPSLGHELLLAGIRVILETSLTTMPWQHGLTGIAPDSAYTLAYQSKTAQVCVEADHATMWKKQWITKVQSYHLHKDRMFRVLTVARDPRRVEQLMRWTVEAGCGTRQFLFTEEPDYTTNPFVLLTRVWKTPKGELVSFLEG